MNPTPDRSDLPAIHSQSDLLATWRRLMTPLGFSRSSIWMMLILADGHPLPQLTEISDSDALPGQEAIAGLVSVLASVAEDQPGARWAFLRSRPGRHGVDDRDRAWARLLLDACHAADVATGVVHLATDERLVPLPLDDLALPA